MIAGAPPGASSARAEAHRDHRRPQVVRAGLTTALRAREDELVVAATARLLGGVDAEDRPTTDTVSEELGREQHRFHVQHLTAALAADRPQLFHEYARWASTFLEARGFGTGALTHHLDILTAVITDHLGPDAGDLARIVVDDALRAVAEAPGAELSELDADGPHTPLAIRFLDMALAGDRRGAVRLIMDAAVDGIPLEELYLGVFAPCLREVGQRWQLGRITVAQEHLVTATTQLAMAQLYPQLFATPRIGRQIVVASVGGELHEVGARIVADLFELRGWDSAFLGASTPMADLVALVVDTAPDVLALSATLPTHVEQVRETIAAVRATGTRPSVLVGGRPFQQVADLWETVGADGSAPDARAAVAVATDLVRAR